MNKIVVLAVAINIEQKIIDRFDKYLEFSKTMIYDTYYVNETKYIENNLLNKSKALNHALRWAIKKYDIIICTDIDIIIPPGLIEYTAEILKYNHNLWVVSRNIDENDLNKSWKELIKIPLRMSGTGSFNAMYREDWIRSGGFDERLVGWGGEDDVFAMRRKQQGIEDIVCIEYPLMHVNHPPRQNKGEIKGGIVPNKKALELGMSGEFKNYLL